MRSRVPTHCTAQLIRGKICARWGRKREVPGKSSSKRCDDKARVAVTENGYLCYVCICAYTTFYNILYSWFGNVNIFLPCLCCFLFILFFYFGYISLLSVHGDHPVYRLHPVVGDKVLVERLNLVMVYSQG